MSEAAIQSRVLLAFAGDRRVRLWRAAAGAARLPDGSFVRFGKPGQADLSGLIVGSGRRLELEVKSPTGRQSPAQKAFAAMILNSGGLYYVVTSPEEALELVGAHLTDVRGRR